MKLNMLLGVASCAAQIEGGETEHNWLDWYRQGKIKDGASPARANDHFNRWKEDIDLMAEMGIGIYRLGVEWARLEPACGKYDEDAAKYYRELLTYMREKGIKPLVTIHHFTNPMWFENMGGFAAPENIPVFLSFVEYVVKLFGELAEEYVTINEPNVFAFKGYLEGAFPPGRHSLTQTLRVMSVMAACHIRAYKLIHKLRAEMGYAGTKVGIAHHARVFAPLRPNNARHRLSTLISERAFQGSMLKAFLRGRFTFPMRKYGDIKEGEYADFLGLNYYSRSSISALGDGVRSGVPVNDLGWEIYPEGIALCAKEMYELLPRPVYITENGTCDNNDSFRCRYIYEHLKALEESGLPVERYYHWCFTDNFEWAEGESARFGLVHVDYETQEREIKRSGRFYSELIKNKGLTNELFDEYVASEVYTYDKS